MPEKQPSLSSSHKEPRLQWAKRYMKTDMKMVLFTDETRATSDRPGGWGKVWVGNGQQRHIRFRRQQGGGGVMIWAGIIGDKLIGPVRVPEGVKKSTLRVLSTPWVGFAYMAGGRSPARAF